MRVVDFTRENDIFNDNYYSSFDSKKTNKIYSIKRFYIHKELTKEMKEFLRFGLQLLAKIGVITEFDSRVFYLYEVDKKKQAEIANLLNSTINIVKKVNPRVRKKLAEKSNLVIVTFFGESIEELLEELNYSEWALKKGNLQKNRDKIYKQYGTSPDVEISLKIDNYHEIFWKKYLESDSDILNFTKTLHQDAKYKELIQKLEAVKKSTKYIEWATCVNREHEILDNQTRDKFLCEKYNTNIKELSDILSIKRNLLINQQREVIFYLWGYIQIEWMKLNKSSWE
ncbi:hypothetical protein [Sporomusa acidovorans]|uniref:Uncharacterized protein n=1 Tax=Sporomusa acidovorans (strain ATCC 49682 / DSM 3132 / Mol) TaxID=1123286 RepID=A0ABZ3IY84_SPOA4|nr:hypothetical protein [Sporomusa acidovorans]OZC22088.1 hypothetical protein SPACI_16060 [Sporomusa acidovorans DSM 3132]SDF66127.1 hypothetical protein SAMN04488499_106613 [Sporomusa acidovorans]